MSRSSGPRRHLLFLLSGPVAERLDQQRRSLDPLMATRVPPHVTLVYPEEVTDESLLLERISQTAAGGHPFPLALGSLESNPATGGVWYRIEDLSGTWTALRRAVLEPPCRPLDVVPHITLVHPRTADPAAHRSEIEPVTGTVVVDEVVYAETSRAGLRVLAGFPLSADPGDPVVGGLLVRDERLLLCRRSPDRAVLPGVWDVPGGHVEEGESPGECLTRELHEELGIAIDPPSDDPWARLRLGHFDLSLFVIDRWAGEPVNVSPAEHDRIRWVGEAELARLPLAHPVYLPLLRRGLKG